MAGSCWLSWPGPSMTCHMSSAKMHGMVGADRRFVSEVRRVSGYCDRYISRHVGGSLTWVDGRDTLWTTDGWYVALGRVRNGKE